ncbi:MAG: DEAD/DEAH box helicase [Raoultibacter sp.]
MTNFNDLGLSETSLAAVKRLGYTEPTPVQQQAIPLALQGHDLIAAAKTGTGKTAAFALPSMDKLGHIQHGQGPSMLVVSPTRELASQIAAVCETIAQDTHHRIVTVVGGMSYDPQITKLKNGVDILIATPGRLIDLMERKAVKLNNVSVLILDEADRMLDMGFLPPMKKIIAATPRQRQTLLFSATIDRKIMDSVGYLLHDPSFVEISHKGETADTVEQYIIRTPQTRKPELLCAVLQEKGCERVIVFARTRSRADSCTRRLRKAGFAAEAIHSDRSQAQRKRALDGFSKGKTDILVATDVLARGIDVSNVDYVINYDLPDMPEDYIHRIGRTGRAGEDGFAISFVTPEAKIILRDIEKLIGKQLSEMPLKNFDFEAADLSAAQRATAANGRRDPELARAASEYDKSQRRKAARKNGAPQEQSTRKRSANTAQPNRVNNNDNQTKKHNPAANPNAAKRPAASRNSSTTHSKSSYKKAPAGSSQDMRPGRAHRAAVASRSKKRTY